MNTYVRPHPLSGKRLWRKQPDLDTGCLPTVGASVHAVCWDLTTCLCLKPMERKVNPFHVTDVEAKAQRSTAACSRPHSRTY